MTTTQSNPRPKILHLVRHAQGFHNLPPEELPAPDDLPPKTATPTDRNSPDTIRDSPLTQKGVADCAQLQDSFPRHANIDLLCSSPLTRVIQTTRGVFDPVIKRGLKVLLVPDAQEGWGDLASTGTALPDFRHAHAGEDDLDLSLLYTDWEVKEGPNGIDPPTLMARAKRLLQWLDAREEREIVLVGHGYFFQYLHGGVDESGEQKGRDWRNLEWRSYRVVSGGSGDEAPRLEDVDLGTERDSELPN